MINEVKHFTVLIKTFLLKGYCKIINVAAISSTANIHREDILYKIAFVTYFKSLVVPLGTFLKQLIITMILKLILSLIY